MGIIPRAAIKIFKDLGNKRYSSSKVPPSPPLPSVSCTGGGGIFCLAWGRAGRSCCLAQICRGWVPKAQRGS